MNKFDSIRCAWTPEEDQAIIQGRQDGLTAKEIKEKYFKNSNRNKNSINSRSFRLHHGNPKPSKEQIYWIQTGLEGLFFEMEKPIERTRWNAQGSAAQTIHGHLV